MREGARKEGKRREGCFPLLRRMNRKGLYGYELHLAQLKGER